MATRPMRARVFKHTREYEVKLYPGPKHMRAQYGMPRLSMTIFDRDSRGYLMLELSNDVETRALMKWLAACAHGAAPAARVLDLPTAYDVTKSHLMDLAWDSGARFISRQNLDTNLNLTGTPPSNVCVTMPAPLAIPVFLYLQAWLDQCVREA